MNGPNIEQVENSSNVSVSEVINNENFKDISTILRNIKLKNINKLTIASLNINSVSNKFEQLKTIIPGNIDNLILVETKIDNTFPTS